MSWDEIWKQESFSQMFCGKEFRSQGAAKLKNLEPIMARQEEINIW